jgi:hypothetical protein
MTAKKPARERREDELEKHYQARRDAGLPAHRADEHSSDRCGVTIRTVGTSCFVETDGEVELDQADVFTVIGELQAAFQAVS